MRIFLHGISAFSHWMAASSRPSNTDAVGSRLFIKCAPTRKSKAYLAKALPHIGAPYHIMVAGHTVNSSPDLTPHVSLSAYVGKPFYRIASGIFAPNPELCFVQLATVLSFHELVQAGDALCGAYYIDPSSPNGLGSRKPLTTKKLIAAFLRKNPGLTGAKAARRALKEVVDKTASPPEAFLAMVLGLPFRHGGYQLVNLEVNPRLRPSKTAQAIARRETLVPDLYCANGRIAFEYDSNAEHMTAPQIARDAAKRLALEADGCKVITVTARQLGRRDDIRRIAQQAYKRQGRRLRPQSRRFEQSQQNLFRMGWSLCGYHSPQWLNGSTPEARQESAD